MIDTSAVFTCKFGYARYSITLLLRLPRNKIRSRSLLKQIQAANAALEGVDTIAVTNF